MDKNIYCGNCGTECPPINKFCSNCGQKLSVHIIKQNSSSGKLIVENEHGEIYSILRKLLNSDGYIIISKENYYVQLARGNNNNYLYFEAVSRYFYTPVGNKDQVFENLGFMVIPNENYGKEVPIAGLIIEKLVQEFKYIFANIYGVEFDNYQIQHEIELKKTTNQISSSSNKTNNQSNSNTKTSKYNGCFIIIAIAIVLTILSTIFENENSTINQKIIVSQLDGSVYQVEEYLKNHYLNDPDSYQSIDWGNLLEAKTGLNYKYSVWHKYRAKNSFGGYATEIKMFYLDENGEVIDIKDF